MKALFAGALCALALMAGCGGGGGGGDGGITQPAAVLAITTQPTDQSVVAGQPARFTVVANHATGFRWQVAQSDWTDVPDAGGASLDLPTTTAAMDGTRYRVIVTGRDGTLASSAATLRVLAATAAPQIVAQPAALQVFAGQEAVFEVTASGPALRYQWQRSGDGAAWQDVAGGTAPRLRIDVADEALDQTQYRLAVSNAAGSVVSATVVLRVRSVPATPAIVLQPTGATVVVGQPATFTVLAVGAPVPALSWQSSVDGATWVDLAGATGAALTLGTTTLADDGRHFRAVAVNVSGTVASDVAVLRVRPVTTMPTVTRPPRDTSVAVGERATFSVEGAGVPTPVPQWQVSFDASEWFNVNGATGASFRTSPATGADQGLLFRAVLNNEVGTVSSAPAMLSIAAGAAGSPTLSLFGGALGGAGSLDGVGTAARVDAYGGLAVDPAGNVIFTEGFGGTVRKMSPAGRVTAWLGFHRRLGHVDGQGQAARFRLPVGVVVDREGRTYVLDGDGQGIRQVSPSGQVETVVSGIRGNAIAADAAGNLYVADWASIVRVSPDRVVTRLVGDGSPGHADGPGATARVFNPRGIAAAADGTLFVADTGSHTVRRVAPDGTVSTIAGLPNVTGTVNGVGDTARFHQPFGIAIAPNGDLLVTEIASLTVRRVTLAGVVSTEAGRAGQSGIEDGDAATARFVSPTGVAVTPSGVAYVADGGALRRIEGGQVSSPAGLRHHGFLHPSAVVADRAGNVYATESVSSVVARYTAHGQVLATWGQWDQRGAVDGNGTQARFNWPTGLAIDASGRLLVVDRGSHTLRAISPSGDVTTIAGAAGEQGAVDGPALSARFNNPARVAVDAAGNIFVTDLGNHTVRRIGVDGMVTTIGGRAGVPGSVDGGIGASRFDSPSSLAVNDAGEVFVADGRGAIKRIDRQGIVSTFAGLSGKPGSADGVGTAARFGTSLSLDFVHGVLHVGDSFNGLLRTVDADGTVRTIVGVAGQVGVRLGADARVGGISSMAAFGPDKVLVVDGSEDVVLVLAK